MRHEALEVRVHGRSVGILRRASGGVRFELADDYLVAPERAVLGQRFENERRANAWTSKRPGRLPPFFSNLLPEGVLADRIRRGLEPDADELELLALVGLDLPGAITVVAATEDRGPPATVIEAAARRGPADPLRFSLAGVQLKFSAFRSASRGLTIPAQGLGGDWIVKIPGDEVPDLAENELWTMTWAERAGLTVPPRMLVETQSIVGLPADARPSGDRAFAVARYDRSAGGPIHQEDLAQVRGVYAEDKYGGTSYEEILALVAATCGTPDALDFVDRLVFVVLSGNLDAHLKNWSLYYPDQKTARLAPVYDQVFIPAFAGRVPLDDQLAFPFSGARTAPSVTLDHFGRAERWLAKTRRVREVPPVHDRARDAVQRGLEAWSAISSDTPAAYRSAVEAHLAELALTSPG